MPLLFLCLPLTVNALSAITAKTIQGTKPYLSTGHVADINAGNDFSLLGVNFDGNSYFTTDDINAKLAALGSASVGHLSLETLAKKLGNGTTGAMSAAYKVPTIPSDANDADGDNFATGSLVGSASIGWYYMNGGTETAVTGADLTKTLCSLTATSGIRPYLKITGPVTLKSEYGDPRQEIYDIANSDSPLYGGAYNPIRRFYPAGKAMVCYVSPNLTGASGVANPNQPTKFDPQYGFLPQPSGVNFPTTGANNLYFYLIIAGLDASSSTWTVTAPHGVSATVQTNTPAPGSGFVSYNANTMVLVTLKGSDKTAVTMGGEATSNVNLPAMVKLTGSDGSNTVDYSFSIKQWFINRSNIPASPLTGPNIIGGVAYGSQAVWCNGLSGGEETATSWRRAKQEELTSATSSKNYSQRILNGGLFDEWGQMTAYSGADFFSNYYWVTEKVDAFYQYAVHSQSGAYLTNTHGYGYYGICAVGGRDW